MILAAGLNAAVKISQQENWIIKLADALIIALQKQSD